MSRQRRGASANRARKGKVLAEAEEIAREVVADVDADVVAHDVAQALLALDADDLEGRAGRKSWGYVEPTEAAWELLEEEIEPFFQEMERHIELGFEAAAAATCAGIVLGLYRCSTTSSDLVLGWAADFPAETAGRALATLARQSKAKQRRAWRLPDGITDLVPEWAEMLSRASHAFEKH